MAKIAIIGSGISGLGAAAILNGKHDITLYEKDKTVGGHARTLTIDYEGKRIAVDTGFIVFNYHNYPNLTALFKALEVPVHQSNMTFAVTVNDGALEWGARSIDAVFGQRSNLLRPAFWRLMFDVMHFNACAKHVVNALPQLTLGQLLQKMNVGAWFAPYYILPMGGAIWSCPLDTMLNFPAKNFIDFFDSHGLLSITGQPQWYTVTGGSQEYIKRLIAPFEAAIRLNCAAVAVTRNDDQVQITDSTGETRIYDHVVMACHADQALAMIKDLDPKEQRALDAFRYQRNMVILHKDSGIMPKRKRCWASWVYHSAPNAREDALSITYWMNLLQGIDENTPLFVTLNPLQPIAKEDVFDVHWFEHPIYSPESVAAQRAIADMQGERNTWFCGAYLRNGFHEDGLASAVEVASRLGAAVPW